MRSRELVRRDPVVGEVALVREDAERQGERLEEPEQRAHLVLHEQRVPVAAAGRGQHDRLVDDRVLPDVVEEQLEQPGVGGAVGRRADDDEVGRLDEVERRAGVRSDVAAERARAELTQQRPELDERALAADALGEGVGDRSDEHARARRGGRAAADPDDRSRAQNDLTLPAASCSDSTGLSRLAPPR